MRSFTEKSYFYQINNLTSIDWVFYDVVSKEKNGNE